MDKVRKTRKSIKKSLTCDEMNNTISANEIDNPISETFSSNLQKRRKRIPIIEQRRLTNIPNQDPDFYYRFVDDIENRLNKFFIAGYEIVDRDGSEISPDRRIQDPSWRQSALSQCVGGGIISYCMRIPRKWWEEDQIKKSKKLDEMQRSMTSGNIVGIPPQNTYGEVKIEH